MNRFVPLPLTDALDGFKRAEFLLGATPLERQPRMSDALDMRRLA